jgi:hypothetical protein
MLRKTNWYFAAAAAAVAAADTPADAAAAPSNAVALHDTSAAAAQKLTAAAECHVLDCSDSWSACLIAADDIEQPTDYPAAPNDCCHNKTVVTSLHAVDGRNSCMACHWSSRHNGYQTWY